MDKSHTPQGRQPEQAVPNTHRALQALIEPSKDPKGFVAAVKAKIEGI
jgi:hypothetical protein